MRALGGPHTRRVVAKGVAIPLLLFAHRRLRAIVGLGSRVSKGRAGATKRRFPVTMGIAHSEREQQAQENAEGRGMLFFLDEPVFEIEVWIDNGQVLTRPVELDLVGIGDTHEDAYRTLGSLIFDYMHFLNGEGGDRTEAEQEIYDLILERIGPPLVKYHMRQRKARMVNLVRSLFGSHADWGASSSALARSDRVSLV